MVAMWIVSVSGFWVAVAWIACLEIAVAVWYIIVAVFVLWLVTMLLRPSVRREIKKGWRLEPPYAK